MLCSDLLPLGICSLIHKCLHLNVSAGEHTEGMQCWDPLLPMQCWARQQEDSSRGVLPHAGLAGIALDLPVTTSESNSGLTPPAVAYALLGKGGAVLIVIMVFMVRPPLFLP